MTLVDTSAWAEFLRGTGSASDRELAHLLEDRLPVRTTDLVVAELLAGAADARAADRMGRLVASLDRCAPPGPLEAERAGQLFRTCRAAGDPVTLAACLLASVALRDDLEVLAADPEFEALARHGGLRLSAASRSAAAPAPTRTDILVLIIEDEQGEVELMERSVAGGGWRSLTVTSAREARTLLEVEKPDAVVLDLVLPDEDGRALLAELRRLPATRDAAVLVVTGRAGPRTRQECFALGANAFVTKPIAVDMLEASLTHVLARDRTREPRPDPLTQPLSRREVHAAMAELRNAATRSPLAVGLLEIHTADDDRRMESSPVLFLDPSDPSAHLARILRRVIAAAGPLLEKGEILGRWSADELLLVSPTRSDTELADLIQAIAAVPELERHLTARVRLVGRDEDLLDAVSAMSAELAAGRPRELVAVASLTRRARPVAALVEDDPITAALVRHRLERSGFVVRHHEDGAEALADIVAEPPDVVILDVQLPSMDGFEILGRMKESDEARLIPVLVFTSLGRQEHVSRAFQLGADDYVTKPFSPGELLTRVLRLVRKR